MIALGIDTLDALPLGDEDAQSLMTDDQTSVHQFIESATNRGRTHFELARQVGAEQRASKA